MTTTPTVGSIVRFPGGVGYVTSVREGKVSVCTRPGIYHHVDPDSITVI